MCILIRLPIRVKNSNNQSRPPLTLIASRKSSKTSRKSSKEPRSHLHSCKNVCLYLIMCKNLILNLLLLSNNEIALTHLCNVHFNHAGRNCISYSTYLLVKWKWGNLSINVFSTYVVFGGWKWYEPSQQEYNNFGHVKKQILH